MIAASVYIIVCSARNRLRVRLRRLREPRYLIGALVGAAYIYFSFFARFRARGSMRRRGRPGAEPPAELAALAGIGPPIAGLLLMAIAAIGWLVPFESGLLTFSQAEIQFLFPAPVSRRRLLAYRMMRSQVGMLFGAAVVAIASPAVGGYVRLRIAIATWLLMCTWKVYFTGISLARSRLSARGRVRGMAWLPLGVTTAGLAIVGSTLWRALHAAELTGIRDLLDRLGRVATTGLSRIALWPFLALARPLFAAWPWPYLLSLASSAAVCASVILWVVLSDSAFQDATEEISARRERERASTINRYRARTTGWRLAPKGHAETVFVWKAILQTVRVVDKGNAIRLAAAFCAFLIMSIALGRRGGWAEGLAAFALAGAFFSIVLGPQALRLDLRQDLQHLEVLKTWPIRSASIIRGELIWPGALLTLASWVMVGLALLYPSELLAGATAASRYSAGFAAMVLAPAIIFGQLAIQNGIALLFPAWVPLGSQRARGLDAMGQRIILLGGTWLLLVLALIPGLIPAAVLWFVVRDYLGAAAWVPAAWVVTIVMLTEVLVATELLGPVYDGIDMSAVEHAEQ